MIGVTAYELPTRGDDGSSDNSAIFDFGCDNSML